MANSAACLVQFLCALLKFAGTVITNFETLLFKNFSALSTSFLITKDDISSKVNCIVSLFLVISTIGFFPFESPIILNGKFSFFISSWTFISL